MKRMIVIGACIAAVVTGCMTMTPEEKRAAIEKEYARIASLPPPKRIIVNDKALNDLGLVACDNFSFAHRLMKEYVAATENNRDYVGFLNDIQYFVKEEGLSEQDAYNKAWAAVLEHDAKVAEAEKVGPRIIKGAAAVRALDPKKKLAELAIIGIEIAKASKSASQLKNSFKGFDAGTIAKAAAAANIIKQLSEALECYAFTLEQYRRVQLVRANAGE